MPSGTLTEDLPSRYYVRIFSWCGLVLGFLHMPGNHALGAAQVLLSCTGIYATWTDTCSRLGAVIVFAAGWAMWAVVETVYLLALVLASSDSVSSALTSFISSSTFPNISEPLLELFKALKEDLTGFVVFSACTSMLFDWLALYWAMCLWTEVTHANLMPESTRYPLLHHPQAPTRPAPASRGGFGTFGTPSSVEHPKRPKPPSFQGRGHKLGAN
jgi:hypothetical protein